MRPANKHHSVPRRLLQVRLVDRVLACACALLCAVGAGSALASSPPGTDYSEAYFDSADGTVLHADIVRPHTPAPGQRTPVLLDITPYNPHAQGPVAGGDAQPPPAQVAPGDPPFVYDIAKRIHAFERGYSVVVVDLPGFGGSGGCWDFAGPGEQTAVKSAVEWAASQPWSTGKVAVVGQSYEGLTGVMALANHPRGLAAVATFAPDVSAYRELYTNGVRRWLSAIVGPFYLAYQLLPGVPSDQAGYQSHYLARWLQPKCVAPEVSEWAGTGWLDSNPTSPFWRARDLLARAALSSVPVFGSQGLLDVEVPASPSVDLFVRLRNLRQLWLGQYTHHNPVDDSDVVGADAASGLERFLNATLDGGPFPPDPAAVVQEAPDLRWRAESQWPPPDARPYNLTVRPGSYIDPSLNASGDNVEDPPAPVIPTSAYPIHGQGSWSFTQPLPYEVHLAGEPALRTRAAGPPAARLVALLYDVSPDGSAFLITRGATLLGGGSVDITLEPQDWRLAPRHRLGLLLTGGDDTEYIPGSGAIALIEVRSGTLTIPALQRVRDQFLPGQAGQAWGAVKRPIQIDQHTILRDTVQAGLPPRETQAATPARATQRSGRTCRSLHRHRHGQRWSAPRRC